MTMLRSCAAFLTLCASPIWADCRTLLGATEPTADASALAARLAESLPITMAGLESKTVSACGDVVLFEFMGEAGSGTAASVDAICRDPDSIRFLAEGGFMKAVLAGPAPLVFDICEAP